MGALRGSRVRSDGPGHVLFTTFVARDRGLLLEEDVEDSPQVGRGLPSTDVVLEGDRRVGVPQLVACGVETDLVRDEGSDGASKAVRRGAPQLLAVRYRCAEP